ncbi:hypothetical protein KP509_11G049700 [Ceratopteris richardii]|uniref:PHD-type zinc finger plants domain-containing protein n=1 Tax=Ceratopteris richardii TaxID=49495 RepID=A0A8T2TUG5_CERRI|nr:hypothetical protein KP509_11G049700 [Ceratopteris richardii]
MCGDVGIAELLFICSRCCHRHQHMYCSRSYPNIGEETYMCNWCLQHAYCCPWHLSKPFTGPHASNGFLSHHKSCST